MKMQFDFRYVLTAAALFIIFAPIAGQACSCVTLGPCSTGWKQGQVVFLGEVTAKDSVRQEGANPNTSLAFRLAVHLTVREIFSGPAAADKDIVVHTGMGGGDCGYPFVVGQSYLVYASTYQDQLITSICSSTTPAVMGAALIQQLRAKASDHAALFGLIGTAPRGNGYEDLIESKALPGVKVRAVAAEGLAYSAISDAHGAYAFGFLPAGTYRLEFDLPAGLSTWQQNMEKPLEIPIGNTESSRGCEVNVFARPDARISGRVIDSEGQAVPGFITIVSTDPTQAEADRRRGGLPGFESKDGKFILWQIPPGRYQLLFYPKVNGQVSFRNAPARSDPIELGLGQRIEEFEFKIK